MKKLISSGSSFEKKLGYSRAVIVGNWAFVSGVTGYNYKTMIMPNDIFSQATNCFETIQKSLIEGGFSLSDTVRVQYTLTSSKLVDDAAPVLEKYMGNIRPAATMVIANMIKPEMLIEIKITSLKNCYMIGKMVALAFMFTGRFVQQNVHIVILTPMYANLSIKKGGLQLFALN